MHTGSRSSSSSSTSSSISSSSSNGAGGGDGGGGGRGSGGKGGGGMFSLASITNLFTGRRKSDTSAFIDLHGIRTGSTQQPQQQPEVSCVRMARISQPSSSSSEGHRLIPLPINMSAKAANQGRPPLPNRGPPLPKRELPPLPNESGRRVSAPGPPSNVIQPPPPPRRNASLPPEHPLSELESRFRFHPANTLPVPEPFTDVKKTYPSQLPKPSSQRTANMDAPIPSKPPPPPPR